VSARDRRILELAHEWAGHSDYATAVAALAEAVRTVIPNGRVYYLGEGEQGGPIIGSLVSGVGITEIAGGVLVVARDGNVLDRWPR
jgi:hypothetical protein